MGGRKGAEEDEECRPNKNKEKDDQDGNRPGRSMLARPKILPVSAIGCGEEEILDNDGDEEPHDDFPAHDRLVKGGNLARSLTVVVR